MQSESKLEKTDSDSGLKNVFRVLLVDDSRVERKIIEMCFKKLSWEVITMDSGMKALEFFNLNDEKSDSEVDDIKIDLIVSDYDMPEMTGYELLKKIKGSSKFQHIPMVIMSDDNSATRIERCMEGGVYDFLTKPVNLSSVKKLNDLFTI